MKNIKNLLLICLFATVALPSAAQNFSFTWSPAFTIGYKGEKNKKIVLASAEKLVMLRQSDGPFYGNYYYEVITYGANLAEASKVKVSPKYGTNTDYQELLDVMSAGDKIMVFYKHFIKEDGVTHIEYATVEDGEISEVTRLGSVSTEKQSKTPDCKVAISPDGSRVGVMAELLHDKEGNEKWMVWLYDNTMKEVLAKEVELDIESKKYRYNDITINNKGTLQVFKKWEVKKQPTQYAVISISAAGDVKKTMIDMGTHEIADKKIFHNSKGNLAICGVYHNEGKYFSPFKGTFLTTFDADGDIVNHTVEYFGKMVLGLVFPNHSKADKEDVHIEGYFLRDVIEDDNGELTVFIEKFEEFKKSQEGNKDLLATDYMRTHKQAIAIRLTAEGTKVWAQELDKMQEYVAKEHEYFWGGTVNIVNKGEVYFIYNFINLPNIPTKGILLGQPGWEDANKKKHFKSEEFGNRAYYATFAAGIDNKGQKLFTDVGYKNSMALVEMYKAATYEVAYSSSFYARHKNTVYLFMQMPAGAENGGTKWHICKVTVN